jgi:hypothetical protein
VTPVWLAWRDIIARPVRTLLALGVVAACAAVFAYAELAESSRDAGIASELDRISAPLRVIAATNPGAAPRTLRVADAERVREAGGRAVRDVEPWLAFDADIGGLKARLVGAPPGSEIAAAAPAEGVALGAVLAERLGAVAGRRVAVAGWPRRVTVLSAVGDADDIAAFVTLEAAQVISGVADAASELRVRLWPGARADDVQSRILEGMPGVAVLRVERGDVAMATTVRAHHLGVALATAFAALVCLAISALLDASERRLELAGLVALGATRRDVIVTVASRSAVVATLGGAAGALVGAVAAAALGDVTTVTLAAPALAAGIAAAAGVLGVLASLPTAILAAWRDPVRELQEAAT